MYNKKPTNLIKEKKKTNEIQRTKIKKRNKNLV